MFIRSQKQIIEDILRTLRDNKGWLKVSILWRKTGLSSDVGKKYVKMLVDDGFLRDERVKSYRIISLTTIEGQTHKKTKHLYKR